MATFHQTSSLPQNHYTMQSQLISPGYSIASLITSIIQTVISLASVTLGILFFVPPIFYANSSILAKIGTNIWVGVLVSLL